MHDAMKRHDVQVLRRAGVTQERVAELTGVSVRSVRMIESEEPVLVPAAAAERAKRRIGRPSKAEPYRGFAAKLLAEHSGLLSFEILRRARLAGYEGGKSALYALVSSLRPRPSQPMVRFDVLPGEFAHHDFGSVDVRFMDRSSKRLHFFASRLEYSGWIEVTIVPDERVETLVRRLVEHFVGFGGVPLVSVFARRKTVALHWAKDGTVTEWNPTFAAVMLDLGVRVEVCWPARRNQKGSVENLAGWVNGCFFEQRRFVDEADLVAQLPAWRDEVNTRTRRATGVTPAARMAEERARLRPLKVVPAELALRIPVSVGPAAYVLTTRTSTRCRRTRAASRGCSSSSRAT